MLLLSIMLASSFSYRQVYAAAPASIFDVDGDGEVKPLSDGLLVLRYLFDFRGTTLINHAIGKGATRTTATQIETYLNDNLSVFDIDGNGDVKPLSDGLLFLRYLFDFRGNTLINNAVGVGATRKTATAIDNYIVTGGAPNNISPTADAGEDKTVQVNKTITLTGSGSDSDGTIVSYEWKNGTTVLATTATFDYTPSVVGTNTLTLTVTDNDGATSSDTIQVVVFDVPTISGFVIDEPSRTSR